jgi:hypothetical protein
VVSGHLADHWQELVVIAASDLTRALVVDTLIFPAANIAVLKPASPAPAGRD